MGILRKISEYLAWISNIAAALLIGALTSVLVVQVILRTFFSSGLAWSVEFSTFTIIWVVMIISNVLIKENELINVDFFDHLLSEKVKRVRNIIYQIIFIILMIMMVYFGFIQALNSIDKTTTGLGISWFYPYLSIPVGASLMLYQYLFKIFENILKVKEE